MSTKTFILLLVSAICVISCSEESAFNDQIEVKVLKVTSISSLEDRKTAYKLLSGVEKSAIWKMHISNTSQNLSLNEEQKGLINEALQIINSENFFTEDKIVNNSKFEIWKYKVTKSFDQKTSAMLFENIGVLPNRTAPKPCECSKQSSFCGLRDNDLYTYTCSVTQCTGESGCGLLWQYSCDGTCKATSIWN